MCFQYNINIFFVITASEDILLSVQGGNRNVMLIFSSKIFCDILQPITRLDTHKHNSVYIIIYLKNK